MRSIGIPVADRSECVFALDTACELGKRLGSDITGYHVIPTGENFQELNRAELWAGAGLSYAAWDAVDDKAARDAADNARSLFDKITQKHGFISADQHGTPEKPHAIFQEKKGAPEKLFSFFGPVNDLLVVSRPQLNGGAKAFLIMMSALMDSFTPVLVLPQKKVSVGGDRVAIAWNSGQAEAMLTHACLPLLKAASDVVLITEGNDEKPGPTASEMAFYLAAHGIEARTKTVKGNNTGSALEKCAMEEGADILLCGAYTRGRVRELIFGGVTEYLLTKSEFPVIMLHV